jgi:predicted DNA-binding WGR domain protein
MTTLAPVQTEQPTLLRKYQLTEFGHNANKEWSLEIYGDPDPQHEVQIRTKFGRVGYTPQVSPADGLRSISSRALRGLIAEKVKKGYREVDLHAVTTSPVAVAVPGSTGPAVHPKVEDLVAMLFQEAGESIDRYLAVRVDSLSQAQIAQGRAKLDACLAEYGSWKAGGSLSHVIDAVTDYYNVIPTRLPRKLSDQSVIVQVVEDLCQNPQDQATRLDQLEAALGTIQATGAHTSAYSRLGAHIALLDGQDPDRQAVVDFIASRNPHGYTVTVRDVFAVTVPSERAAYDASDFGKHLELRLTHGTANANVRHILHEKGPGSGLRLPKYPSSGWFLGSGIYFADRASKSIGYTRSGGRNPRVLLLCDVAVGDMYTPKGGLDHAKAAPQGYHSVLGKAGYTGVLRYNEYVVYRPSQATIRYLATFDSY